jgi:hypothetical protein
VKGAEANFTKLKILPAYDGTICYKHELTFFKPNICHHKELLLLACKMIHRIY